MARFFFKQKSAYEISACLVGSEICIRDSIARGASRFFRDQHPRGQCRVPTRGSKSALVVRRIRVILLVCCLLVVLFCLCVLYDCCCYSCCVKQTNKLIMTHHTQYSNHGNIKCAHTYIHIYMYICIYIYLYMYIYICIYICVYIQQTMLCVGCVMGVY